MKNATLPEATKNNNTFFMYTQTMKILLSAKFHAQLQVCMQYFVSGCSFALRTVIFLAIYEKFGRGNQVQTKHKTGSSFKRLGSPTSLMPMSSSGQLSDHNYDDVDAKL